jgi:hypothetical protein
MNNLQVVKRLFLLNIRSFLALQIDQHKADTPTRIIFLDCLSTPFNQFPNKFIILVGDGRSKMKLTVRQRSLAKG